MSQLTLKMSIHISWRSARVLGGTRSPATPSRIHPPRRVLMCTEPRRGARTYEVTGSHATFPPQPRRRSDRVGLVEPCAPPATSHPRAELARARSRLRRLLSRPAPPRPCPFRREGASEGQRASERERAAGGEARFTASPCHPLLPSLAAAAAAAAAEERISNRSRRGRRRRRSNPHPRRHPARGCCSSAARRRSWCWQ